MKTIIISVVCAMFFVGSYAGANDKTSSCTCCQRIIEYVEAKEHAKRELRRVVLSTEVSCEQKWQFVSDYWLNIIDVAKQQRFPLINYKREKLASSISYNLYGSSQNQRECFPLIESTIKKLKEIDGEL